MDGLNMDINANKAAFNWDDLEVGSHNLDHSENFFARKHIKHERYESVELLREQMESAALDDDGIYNPFDSMELENKENSSPNKEHPRMNFSLKVENHGTNENVKDEDVQSPTAVDLNMDNVEEVLPSKDTVECDAQNMGASVETPIKPPTNIKKCLWSISKPTKPVNHVDSKRTGSKLVRAPHAYEFKNEYERRRLEAKRRIEEEEQKMREFHSRPAPNFKLYHQQLSAKKVVHAVTHPSTPKVLKNSREAEEKRRKRLEELQRQNHHLPKVFAREPNVLKEEPFVPKKTATVIQSRPFHLRSELRLQERKQFDAAIQRMQEEKVKQEEEERKKREVEVMKELRKKATFKARPNPFKQ